MARCKERLGGRVTHEFLQSQVEIGTGVCATVGEARAELLELRQHHRRDRARVRDADDRRLDPPLGALAASRCRSTWTATASSAPSTRALARRMAICGMHVHAGIEDPDLRVDLMSQVSYFMPHLLALSSSSPFWEGHDTGLKAFRPIIIGDLPRSGLPEIFESWNDWQELLQVLAETGMVTDPSKIWWDMRP